MKTLSQYILEKRGEEIDDNWLNANKPVMIKSGKTALVSEIDLSQVPNVIKGVVNISSGKTVDYEWLDDGSCIKATDQYGNPKKPDENDKLVKAV